ncbi:hypothetical protein [Methylobacterium sp. WSM2598]|uniref:hypothetical protein n=1 Tax=Methylobacterium sp. WSM2598 TaxID=398261 RepID=UPI0018DF75D7|nr:hypothetical protein [Methylobacterium sp. WSM2598]
MIDLSAPEWAEWWHGACRRIGARPAPRQGRVQDSELGLRVQAAALAPIVSPPAPVEVGSRLAVALAAYLAAAEARGEIRGRRA